MYKLAYLICFLLLTQSSLQAQSKKELIEQGDNAYKKGDYRSTVNCYSKLLYGSSGKAKKDAKNTTPSENETLALNRLAESYRHLHDYKNAELFYAKAVETKSDLFPDARYYYGLVLMNNSRYTEAEKQFDTYLSEGKGTQLILARTQKAGCSFAVNNEKKEVQVFALDTGFNKGMLSLGVIYFTDYAIAFASAPSVDHNSKTVKDPKTETDDLYTDIYISSASDEGQGWDPPVRLAGPINSNQSEAPGAMGADRKTFYFTRWNPQDKNDCNVYVSKMFNHHWMEPLRIEGINQNGYRTMHPSLTADETRLYFVSDRPGGQGGLDIWFATIDSDGNLGEPQNLGAPINTPGDEVTPFYHSPSQTLFFSSNGQIGLGGLDVYKTHFSEDANTWDTPINLGAPLNSSMDDHHFIMDKEQVSGFFTSDRLACTSGNETEPHCLKVFGFNKPALHFTLNGHVYDSETEGTVPNARVIVKDVRGIMEPFFVSTDEQGYYHADLPQDRELFLKAQTAKHFADAAAVKTIGQTESTSLEQDFFLRPIPLNKVEIEGIEYNSNQSIIKPGSEGALDKLYEFLALNDNLVVEIEVHTDCRGNDVQNQKLSQERAQSCVDYLVSKGIKKERLVARGKGESAPVPGYECATIEKIKISEPNRYNQMHQRNNRTAYRVVSDLSPNKPVFENGR